MAYDGKKKAKIRADVKAGKLNKTQIAQKWRISRNTLNKIINESDAVYAENRTKVNNKIERQATEKIIETEANTLFDYTSKYIANVDYLNKAHQANLGAYFKELKDAKGKLSKADADKYKTFQQFFKLAAETVKINFEGMRLAMGLDKKESNFTVNNIQDLSTLSDEELYALRDQVEE
jgi:hypothetical protein